MQIGPPNQIGTFSDARKAAMDQAGQTIAVIHGVPGSIAGDHAHVIRGDSDYEPVQLRGHPAMSRIAVSPDGEWVASGTWQGVGVRLWDSRTGARSRPVRERTERHGGLYARRQVAGGGRHGAYRFWEVGTWKHSHDIPVRSLIGWRSRATVPRWPWRSRGIPFDWWIPRTANRGRR